MNTEVNLAGIKMKNPITVASGTFGYGREFAGMIDLNKLNIPKVNLLLFLKKMYIAYLFLLYFHHHFHQQNN